MRTRRSSRASHLGDPLAGFYVLALLYVDAPAVTVERRESAAVIDDAVIAVTGTAGVLALDRLCNEDDHACARSHNGRAVASADVYSGVELLGVIYRVNTPAER